MPSQFARNKTGKNRYGDGAGTGIRSAKSFGYRPLIITEEIMAQECEGEGITKTEWVDRAIAFYLSHRTEHQ
jgi:hypothetical protein